MTRSLHLLVVAEAGETDAELAFLDAHGCDVAQGFLHARPIRRVSSRRGWPVAAVGGWGGGRVHIRPNGAGPSAWCPQWRVQLIAWGDGRS